MDAAQQVRQLLSGTEPQAIDPAVHESHKYSRSVIYAAKEDVHINETEIIYNASPSVYVEEALRNEPGSMLTVPVARRSSYPILPFLTVPVSMACLRTIHRLSLFISLARTHGSTYYAPRFPISLI